MRHTENLKHAALYWCGSFHRSHCSTGAGVRFSKSWNVASRATNLAK